jgi:hypothetical protein
MDERDYKAMNEELKKETSTIFYINNQEEILKICANGDIFVKGNLVENDKEVVDALREFLKSHGYLK